jgi:hypothetical protein
VVNLVAVLSSVIYVTLHSAERYGLLDTFGSAGWLWAFSLIHGLPLATLNFFYGLLVHSHLKGIAEEEAAEQQAAAAAAAAVAHKCDWCGTGFASPAAVNGHKKGCPSRPQPIP